VGLKEEDSLPFMTSFFKGINQEEPPEKNHLALKVLNSIQEGKIYAFTSD